MLNLDKFHFSARSSLISVARSNESVILQSLHNGGMVPLMELDYSGSITEAFLPWELQITANDKIHKMCLFGKDGHPEVMGTVDRTKHPTILFERAEELEERLLGMENADFGITMAAQTTMGEEEWKKSKKFLKKLYTNPKIFDTICSVTKNRQEEAAKLAAMADVTIVIGGRTSSNTKELYNIAAAHCPDTRLIERAEELAPPPAQDITVAITAGASTPDGLIMEVYKKWTNSEVSPKCWKKHSKL